MRTVSVSTERNSWSIKQVILDQQPPVNAVKRETASSCRVWFIIGNYFESAGLSRLNNFLPAAGIQEKVLRGRSHPDLCWKAVLCNPSGQGHMLPPSHILVILLIYSQGSNDSFTNGRDMFMIVVLTFLHETDSVTAAGPRAWRPTYTLRADRSSLPANCRLRYTSPAHLLTVRKVQLAPIWMVPDYFPSAHRLFWKKSCSLLYLTSVTTGA